MPTTRLIALLVLLSLPLASASPQADESDGTPTVVPEPETPAVARDVGVADLPLLIEEPPRDTPDTDIPAPVIGGPGSTLNPFAPLQLPGPQTETPPAQPQAPAVTEEAPAAPPPTAEAAPVPAAPERAASPTAPIPEARLGAPVIPKALTDRMLPGATPRAAMPGVLSTALGAQSSVLSSPLGSDAAIRVPSSLPPLVSAPAVVGTTETVSSQVVRRSGLTPLSLSGTMLGHDENPTSTFSNRVSRSLVSLRVSFTAMSTGTGIFRVGDNTRPILLAIGEPLPGTRLVLSQLTAQGAQFTEDDVRHTLFLNP